MLDPLALFGAGIGEIWMEIGFGAGEHLAAQAMRHRGVGFIGCEAYLNGIAALLPRLAEANLDNVRVYDDDARGLLGSIASASLARIYVLFPDPWPKTRHHNRRLISPEVLGEMGRILCPGGQLRIASDHIDYVRWMLEHVTREASFEWMARSRTDWRTRPADAVETRYEQKALDRGGVCTYLSFQRKGGARSVGDTEQGEKPLCPTGLGLYTRKISRTLSA